MSQTQLLVGKRNTPVLLRFQVWNICICDHFACWTKFSIILLSLNRMDLGFSANSVTYMAQQLVMGPSQNGGRSGWSWSAALIPQSQMTAAIAAQRVARGHPTHTAVAYWCVGARVHTDFTVLRGTVYISLTVSSPTWTRWSTPSNSEHQHPRHKAWPRLFPGSPATPGKWFKETSNQTGAQRCWRKRVVVLTNMFDVI